MQNYKKKCTCHPVAEKNNGECEKCIEKKPSAIKTKKLKEVFSSKVWSFKKNTYLCTRISTETELQTLELGYGVMVTLQILVLSFLVRVRVPQHTKSPSA